MTEQEALKLFEDWIKRLRSLRGNSLDSNLEAVITILEEFFQNMVDS